MKESIKTILKNLIWQFKKFIKGIKNLTAYLFYCCITWIEGPQPLRSKAMSENHRQIIVSITSYGKRLEKVHYVVRSILRQYIQPDRIVLYLGEDVKKSELPKSLTKLTALGLEIEFREDNLKPHKKYYYAMKENPEAIVITIDDDIIYPKNLISNLLDTYSANPDCIIACRAHKMKFDEHGELYPYNTWLWEYKNESGYKSKLLFATGGGGTLYPTWLLHNRDLFDTILLKKLSYDADDVWLKINEIRRNLSVCLCFGVWEKIIEIPGTQRMALGKKNVDKNRNDIYLKKCFEEFKLNADDFVDL